MEAGVPFDVAGAEVRETRDEMNLDEDTRTRMIEQRRRVMDFRLVEDAVLMLRPGDFREQLFDVLKTNYADWVDGDD